MAKQKKDRGKPVGFIRKHGKVIPIYAKRATNVDNVGAGVTAGGIAAGTVHAAFRSKASDLNRSAGKAFRIAERFDAREMPRFPTGLGKKGKRLPPDIFEMSRYKKGVGFFKTSQAKAVKFRKLGNMLAQKATKLRKLGPRAALAAGLISGLGAYIASVATDGD